MSEVMRKAGQAGANRQRFASVSFTGVPSGEHERPCPACSEPGRRVSSTTVRSLVTAHRRVEVVDQDYCFCPNPSCPVIYFEPETGKVFMKGDVRVRVWFKEAEEPLPICYCSNLARWQIVEAVRQGNHTIEAVRRATGANLTGQCLTENPTGHCCHQVFQQIIDETLGRRAPDKVQR